MYLHFPFHRFNRDLESWFRNVDQLFGSAVEQGTPPLNVYANEDGAWVTAELPGVDPAAIEVNVHENKLTISGTKEPLPIDGVENLTWHRNERQTGSFSRTLILPFRIDAKKVKAESRNGVLLLKLAREEADKPRKITVKVA